MVHEILVPFGLEDQWTIVGAPPHDGRLVLQQTLDMQATELCLLVNRVQPERPTLSHNRSNETVLDIMKSFPDESKEQCFSSSKPPCVSSPRPAHI